MASNYCSTSSRFELPQEELDRIGGITALQSVFDEAAGAYEESSGDEFFSEYRIIENRIDFVNNEFVDLDGIAYIMRYIIEKLELDIPFYCSYANSCSSMRIDEFGGGAFLIVRGENIEWIDSANLYSRYLLEKRNALSNLKKQNEVIGF